MSNSGKAGICQRPPSGVPIQVSVTSSRAIALSTRNPVGCAVGRRV
jgi:hypothetical protein